MRFDSEILRRCWVLAGPTASGKSAAGIELAVRIEAEIVSLDSMAIYRGMDIGTAKPTISERQRIPHHLIDIVEPSENFSVADYLAEAESACRQILDRGHVPLFVGGTGLYLRSLLRGVFEGPPADATIRQRLEAEARAIGAQGLHERLRQIDPSTAARLHPNDLRRVVRALEVAELTRRPLSEQQAESPLPVDLRPGHVYWLNPPRDWLHHRIDMRVDAMMSAGLLDETRRLLNRRGGIGRTASQALGYRELIQHLTGELSLTEAVELIKLRTRQFAKRQRTWFRNLEECQAVDISGAELPADIAEWLLSFQSDGRANT